MTLKVPEIAGFVLGAAIAEGGFSRVYRASHPKTWQTAACKVVLYHQDTTKEEKRRLYLETALHGALKTHPNILELYAQQTIEFGSEQSKIYYPGVYMLLEYADGGDLFDKIVPDVGIDEDLAQVYFTQLASGVQFIHSKGICHRDLKPENILLASTGLLKLSDFGLSDLFAHKGKEKTFTERCGSLPYVAPELSDLDRPYRGPPVDCWGLGVVLFTLLAGNTPWDEPTNSAPEFVMYQSGQIWKEEPWSRIKGSVATLLCGLLSIDPVQRMSVADTLSHPWVIRQSQFKRADSETLAKALAKPLVDTGDMQLAEPLSDMDIDMLMDDYADGQPPPNTYFTQSLMLFSQTQSGARHTPHLTRFYTKLPPASLMPIIITTLESLGVRTKAPQTQTSTKNPSWSKINIKIGGYDARKEMFKGYVEAEDFRYRDIEGSFVVLKKDKGNPISWRQLWKALVSSENVHPWVLRRS